MHDGTLEVNQEDIPQDADNDVSEIVSVNVLNKVKRFLIALKCQNIAMPHSLKRETQKLLDSLTQVKTESQNSLLNLSESPNLSPHRSGELRPNISMLHRMSNSNTSIKNHSYRNSMPQNTLKSLVSPPASARRPNKDASVTQRVHRRN